jgi:hypothetical protein
LTLNQTAKLLRTTVDKLRYYFPDLCQEVSRRASRIALEERERLAANAPTLIESVGAELVRAGRYPSYRAVHRALPRPARVRLELEPALKDLRARIAMASGMVRRAGARDGSMQLNLDDGW